MLQVRNLENGRIVTLRLNDRGPASPRRLLSVTPAAARALGMIPNQATRIEIKQDEALSRMILRQVKDPPKADLIAAPVTDVQEQSLTPSNPSDRPEGSAPAPLHEPEARPAEPSMGIVTQGPVGPGELWIDAGRFSQRIYARRLARSLSGAVLQEGQGRSTLFSVRLGPFELVTQADAALDRARSGGVTDARIIVE